LDFEFLFAFGGSKIAKRCEKHRIDMAKNRGLLHCKFYHYGIIDFSKEENA